MEIKALGAARIVGKSAFLIKGDKTNLLLDYGAITNKEPEFPLHISPNDIDSILLSHAHLDHCGGLPMFYVNGGVDLYSTDISLELMDLLLNDFINISGYYLPFQHPEIKAMKKYTKDITLNESVQIGEFLTTYKEAGHIPGGASITLESGSKRILYTGDINAIPTQLIRGAETDFGELDLIITESTYGSANHKPRDEVEETFVNFARKVVERKGVLLVPAFAIGRSQEIACVLKKHNFPYPVAIDGMALRANDILVKHQNYLRDPKLFNKALNSANIVNDWGERRKVVDSPGVIIAPAGMLVGGTAAYYKKIITKRPENGVALVSFQAPNTPGKTLWDKKIVLINGKRVKVKCDVEKFDFSSHSGQKELFDMFNKIQGNPKVLAVHGENQSCLDLASDIKKKFGWSVIAPKPGQTIEL